MSIIEKTARKRVFGLLILACLLLSVALHGQEDRKNRKNGASTAPYGKSVWEIPGWRSPLKNPEKNPGAAPGKTPGQAEPGSAKKPGATDPTSANPAPVGKDLLPVLPEPVPADPIPLQPLFAPDESGPRKAQPGAQPVVPVLCYHQNFAADDDGNQFNVTPAALEEQLAYLRRNDYTSIGLDDLYYYINGESRDDLPARPVLITFDDGIKTNRTEVAALLEKYDYTAVLFVYPAALDGDAAAYLDWGDVRSLLASGRFEIGSHTLDHPLLPREAPREIRRQLEQSRLRLQKELGVQVYDLAYPFGLYDQRVMKIARAAGYRMAFTINMGTGRPGMDLFALPRIMITREYDLERFAASLRIHSPDRIQLNPPDGARVEPGRKITFKLKDFDPESVNARLNGIPLALIRDADTYRGVLPRYNSRSGFLPLTIRGRFKDGRSFFRQFLYIDGK